MIHSNDPGTQRGDGPMLDTDEMSIRAREVAERVKQAGGERFHSGKEAAADRAERLADAIHDVGAKSQREGDQTIATYASDLASGLERFADTLRHRSVNDLVNEAQLLARRNPALFIAGSIGVGFAIARFLKASSDSHDARESDSPAAQLEEDASREYHDAPVGDMRGVHTERTDLGSSDERAEYLASTRSPLDK